MKKLLILGAVTLLLAAMVGCGKGGQDADPMQTGQTEESTYSDQNTETSDGSKQNGVIRDDTEKGHPDYYEYFEFSIK